MAAYNPLEPSDDGVISEINMTPLVDVMLVLLIIFMITVPVLTQTVKVDLPRATAAKDTPPPDAIELSVNAQGTIYWGEQAIDTQTLKQRLQAAAQRIPQAPVHLRGDRNVRYETVLQVMAQAQQAGITSLGFITDPTTKIP